MRNENDILELVELGSYGSFPLQGLSKPFGIEQYVYAGGSIEIELVEQSAE